MKVTLVVNPMASAADDAVRTAVIAALGADHDLDVVTTTKRGHAVDLAGAAAAARADVVVALGGDGTANEVAKGVAGTATALAALPGGSTNVFARGIGYDRDPRRATAQLVEALAASSTRRVAMGTANSRPFLFHAGLGFDAEVIELVERRASLKRRLGQMAFLSATVATWLGQRDRLAARFTAQLHGTPSVECRGAFAICLLSDPYTFLGAKPLNVLAGQDEGGGLSLVVFDNVRALTLLAAGAVALSGRRPLADLPGVAVHCGLAAVTVDRANAEAPLHYQVDGDYLGVAERIELRYEADRLTLVVPRVRERSAK